jgi:thymidylate synthase
VSAWNPAQFNEMALPPCHWAFQFHVEDISYGDSLQHDIANDRTNDNGKENRLKLNCQVNMRSGDMALGVPFNIASYAMLTHIIARIVNMTPGELVLTITDCHLYTNHIEGVSEQIKRRPYRFPTIEFDENLSYDIDEIAASDLNYFKFINYHAYPSIKYDMAI